MEPNSAQWDVFNKCIDFESDTNNFKHDFKTMLKKHALAFIANCKAAWITNDGILTEEEFCSMNANMSQSFFESKIK
jgi:hypothetical protein